VIFLAEPPSQEDCIPDKPRADFTSIPEFLIDSNWRLTGSRISDRLLCLRQTQSMAIPSVIRGIGNSFHSIQTCGESRVIPVVG
jgi:hypothetical protein